ncbi:MAG TPA: NAD-dependent epimerase/dehydratase family protein, partial [Alphaproteobacteria bacterium]|nr:NAD-dependent epimerase/dehydratase family protein [Alphaproteobacteria bacterium]
KGEPITVYGDGSQTRAFCYVDDLIDGFVRLMEAPDTVTGPVNLGNPVEFTIAQLAEKVIDLVGSPSKIIRKPLPADDPTQRCPNITMAKNVLGWTPKIPLEVGLRKTVDYFDKLLKEKRTPTGRRLEA